MSFGLRTGALAAQITTNGLMYTYRHQGYGAINYIDDMGSAEKPPSAAEAYSALLHKKQCRTLLIAVH